MNKIIKTLAVTGGVLFAAKGLDNRIEVTEYKIKSPKIGKGFDGFRIVQISDYHCDTIPGITEEIKTLKPDIIVSTGDLVHDRGSYMPAVRLMERLVRIAPVYSITGNHDIWRDDYRDFERELDKIGVVTLHDESVLLHQGDDEIRITGIDDPFSMDKDNIIEHIEGSVAKIPNYDG